MMKKFILLLAIIVSLFSLTMSIGTSNVQAGGNDFPPELPIPPQN